MVLGGADAQETAALQTALGTRVSNFTAAYWLPGRRASGAPTSSPDTWQRSWPVKGAPLSERTWLVNFPQKGFKHYTGASKTHRSRAPVKVPLNWPHCHLEGAVPFLEATHWVLWSK